jgi:hypothetical protein
MKLLYGDMTKKPSVGTKYCAVKTSLESESAVRRDLFILYQGGTNRYYCTVLYVLSSEHKQSKQASKLSTQASKLSTQASKLSKVRWMCT